MVAKARGNFAHIKGSCRDMAFINKKEICFHNKNIAINEDARKQQSKMYKGQQES